MLFLTLFCSILASAQGPEGGFVSELALLSEIKIPWQGSLFELMNTTCIF